MRIHLSSAVFAISFALAGAAAAEPAPIVFAEQGGGSQPVQTASLDNRLAGGADNSYGYGRAQPQSGAVIDLRRPSSARTPEPSAQQVQVSSAPATVEQSTSWLEQERVGPPYEANGRWYVPTPEPGYEQVGEASWYGPTFHGQAAANGETYDQDSMTAAHPTLPLNSLVQVTNLQNGREAMLRITDRGPFVNERLIDVSHAAAGLLGFEQNGRARVHVRYLGPAPRRVNADGESAPASAAVAPYSLAPSATPSTANGVEEGPLALTVAAAPASSAPASPTLQQISYTPQPVAAPAGAFVVQVGAFSDLENAQRVRALIEQAGPVSVDVRQTARGELFRVRVGPWETRAQAEAARQSLAGLGYPEAIIAQP